MSEEELKKYLVNNLNIKVDYNKYGNNYVYVELYLGDTLIASDNAEIDTDSCDCGHI